SRRRSNLTRPGPRCSYQHRSRIANSPQGPSHLNRSSQKRRARSQHSPKPHKGNLERKMKYQSRILEGMPKPRAPKYAAALIPAILGILSLIIFAVLTFEWLPKLSEKIATHWGIDGAPNDFQSPWFVF